jgi:hypothetical protein
LSGETACTTGLTAMRRTLFTKTLARSSQVKREFFPALLSVARAGRYGRNFGSLALS